MMMNKKWVVISLTLSAFLGLGAGMMFNANVVSSSNEHAHAEQAFSVQNASLEQELWKVDLIVRGTIEGQQETREQDAGLKGKRNYSFDVTPAIVKISEVLYGEAPPSDTINLLQHGSASSSEAKEFVKKGEEVILLLVKTSKGEYWAYNRHDGLWKVKDGKVISEATAKTLNTLKNLDVGDFKQIISKAAKNKQKNPFIKN